MSDALTEQRLGRLEQDGVELRADVKAIRGDLTAIRVDLASIWGRLGTLQWITGTLGGLIVAFLIAIFLKLFIHG